MWPRATHTRTAKGEGSPLARVYDLDGRILLLGVAYDRNTSFHLAEYRIPETHLVEYLVAETARRKELLPAPEHRRVVWREFDEIAFMSDAWLTELGEAFEATSHVRVGRVGSAEDRLVSQRRSVDFAVGWLQSRYRSPT